MDILNLVLHNNSAGILQNEWDPETINQQNADGMTPLMLAAKSGFDEVVLALKEKGADVNIVDATGRKAVHYAALYGHGLIIILLIEGGCGG